MSFAIEIIPGIGTKDLQFGMWRSDVEAVLGKPTNIEPFDVLENKQHLSEIWTYDPLDLEITFEEHDDWRLATIDSCYSETSLKGNKLIGLNMQEAISKMHDIGYCVTERAPLPDNLFQLCFGEPQIDLWFEDSRLYKIVWGYLWMDNDKPKWPNR